jgi:hypothetical protein
MKKILGFIFVVSLVVIPAQLFAYGFDCITNNSGVCAALEPQLTFTLTNDGGNPVFTIDNASSGYASSVAAIYWDDDNGVLGSFISFIPSGLGVVFSTGGTPSKLPSQDNAIPPFATDYRVTADSPAPTNGINPGEFLGIKFNGSYSAVFAAVEGGDLRVALHVQAYAATGASESLVDGPSTQVPEPTTVLLLGLGLVGLAGLRRKMSQ